MEALHKPQDAERLPEAPPLWLHLPGRQDAVSVGADGEECRIAQVQQPGKAHHNVETEREHREGSGVGRSIEVAAVAVDQRKYEQEDRRVEDDEPPTTLGGDAAPPGADRT